MKKAQSEAKLKAVAKQLDKLAASLEDAGFESHAELLDKAADNVENVQEAFARL